MPDTSHSSPESHLPAHTLAPALCNPSHTIVHTLATAPFPVHPHPCSELFPSFLFRRLLASVGCSACGCGLPSDLPECFKSPLVAGTSEQLFLSPSAAPGLTSQGSIGIAFCFFPCLCPWFLLSFGLERKRMRKMGMLEKTRKAPNVRLGETLAGTALTAYGSPLSARSPGFQAYLPTNAPIPQQPWGKGT